MRRDHCWLDRVHCWLDVGDMADLLPGPVLKGVEYRAGDGLVGALFRDEQHAGQVGRDADTAEEGEHGEGDPDDRDVYAQVVGHAGADAGQHAPVIGAAERWAADGERRLCVGVNCRSFHTSSVRPRAFQRYREHPWTDPDAAPAPVKRGKGRIRVSPDGRDRVCRVMMVRCRNRPNRRGRRSTSMTGAAAPIVMSGEGECPAGAAIVPIVTCKTCPSGPVIPGDGGGGTEVTADRCGVTRRTA